MNYGNIKYIDTANGLGIRTSLFVSGCHHHCKGCFQPETWDPNYGALYTEEATKKIITSLKPSHVNGLTLLGGDPFYMCNRNELVKLLQEVRKEFRDTKNVWCYTGSLYEDLLLGGKEYDETGYELLKLIDVLVDGPFVLEKKSLMLKFRGSSNQRIIDVQESLKKKEIVLVDSLM